MKKEIGLAKVKAKKEILDLIISGNIKDIDEKINGIVETLASKITSPILDLCERAGGYDDDTVNKIIRGLD